MSYDIYLPSYSIGADVYDKIYDICRPYGKRAVVVGGHTAMEKALPKIKKAIEDKDIAIAERKPIKIWSAACSTGDEPYSLAMAFSKHVSLSDIKILATDIDKQVIEHAKVGLYSEKSIAGVPADLKKKYFTQIGNSYQISDDIKKCVTFKEHNLLKDVYPKDYDLILCRNVVIYFTDEAKDMIYKNFYGSLKSKGVLFIGSTEQISNYKDLGFNRMSSFYFEKP